MIIDEEGRILITQDVARWMRERGESLENYAVIPYWEGKLTWPIRWNPERKCFESVSW